MGVQVTQGLVAELVDSAGAQFFCLPDVLLDLPQEFVGSAVEGENRVLLKREYAHFNLLCARCSGGTDYRVSRAAQDRATGRLQASDGTQSRRPEGREHRSELHPTGWTVRRGVDAAGVLARVR